MNDPEVLRRALVQKLESMQRGGVLAIPKPDFAPAPSPPPSSTAPRPAERSLATPPGAADAPSAPAVASPQPRAVPAPAAPAPLPAPAVAATPFTSEVLPDSARLPALQSLAQEVAQCTLCSELAKKRTQTVFGVGNPNARLVFFGEAPGADEDRMGEPFVGKAGQLLTKIIEACQLRREDVYILNVLKCRPPGNRNPTPAEATHCRPFFEKQLEIIRPEVICCLGSIAATTLLETTLPVGRLRGRFHQWRGISVAVTYHPAYLLRTPAAKKTTWADMKMVMQKLGVTL